MNGDVEDEAREFWNRFDELRGSRTVKEISESIGIDYEAIRVQRTRRRIPRLSIAVKLAAEVGSSLEYLACGVTKALPFSRILYNAYITASDDNKKIVKLALGLDESKENVKISV